MARETELRRIASPKQLAGDVVLPGDKSISHRAIILNSLASGRSKISNLSPAKDCQSTIRCLKALGVQFTRPRGEPLLHVHGIGAKGLKEPTNVLNAGNSGTTMRLLAGVLAAQPFLSVLTGDSSLRSRPMKRLIEPLRLMGAELYGRNNDSLAPIVVRGRKLQGIRYQLPVPSAQIKSAILLAGLFANGTTTVEQTEISRDHTERLLAEMGAELESSEKLISVSPLKAPLAPLDINIPGDISSAAYWLVAGAIHPDARLKIINCGVNTTRTGIIDTLRDMGAKLRIENQRLEGNEPVADLYIESSQLHGIEIGEKMIPRIIDEIPVLAVAACAAKGDTVIRGAGELRVKESDRISTTVKELSHLGARIEELPDGMVIHGGSRLVGNEAKSHADHRLAMSLAIAALVARGKTVIRNAQVAEISYPDFWQQLDKLAKY
jgi:3-phosphoshikimate 1-carboxyvinyltransferase